jgi:glycosyltransferase involved in cell wall biosynthesis
MSNGDPGAVPLIDVCIASYKRPEGLRRLLQSLAGQETEGRFRFAARVADNDAQGTARSIVEEARQTGLEISYEIEPVQNISRARNRSFALGRGEWIATIDDDVYAEPRWLLTLFDFALVHDADAVQGRLIPEFQPEAPEYLRSCFVLPNPPAGSVRGFVYDTSGILFRRALIEGIEEPFDPRAGLRGGEDTVFFTAQRDAGRKIVWCPDAVVRHPVPPERARLGWVVQRRFRHGNAPRNARKSIRYYSFLIRATATLSVVIACYLAAGLVSSEFRSKALNRILLMLLMIAEMAGALARRFGYEYEEYKRR